MPISSLTLVAWMLVSMVVVWIGLSGDWSWWAIGLCGVGLLIGAYAITRKAWDSACEEETKIRESLNQLRRLTPVPHAPSSGSVELAALSSELEKAVAHVRERVRYLDEEREKISAIVENLIEGVVAFDMRGRVLFSNSRAKQILGLDEPQLQGLSVLEVIRHEKLARFVEECRELALHDRRYIEVEIHTPTRMTLAVYGLPFPLSNQMKGSVIVLHDVTQLRRLEKVRAEFIDNVSHELRTPLAAIIGYLETLIDEPSLETPNNRKFVHVAHRHAERLNRLVDDLRSLSEIESGSVVVRLEAVELQSLVDEVTEMLRLQAEKKGIHFLNHMDQTAWVWADRDRIVQILFNLVDNAIKYSFEGGTVSFLVQRLDSTLRLRIADTGQGIPSTDLSRITERFYRVDRARSREEGGTGLGLPIVKHLVQLLNGQLRIQSELGKGTTVDVEFPISSQ